jgi:hypothetical protein
MLCAGNLGLLNKCLTKYSRVGYTTLSNSRREEISWRAAKPNQRRHTMKNIKKIAALLTILGVTAGFTQAATHHESKPDGTLRLSTGGFALGIGASWGSGTLTYRGKNYPVKVKGLSVGRVGATSSSAYGEVFNLKHLQDFNGHYDVSGRGTRGVTLGAGKTGTIMSNQAGVIVRISSTQQGVAVNATGGGMDLQLK